MFVNRRFLLISLLLLVPICISAQSFNIPSTWQNSTSSIARNDRIEIAENALRKVLGASSGTNPNSHSAAETASLLATLALNDWITGNSAYNTTVATILHKFSASHLNFQRRSNPLNSDTLLWGLASFYAHRAYNGSLYLDTAVGVWNYAHQFFITEDQAAHGVQPTRNFTLQPQCNGHSLAGGVYLVPDVQSDDRVNTETVGAFLTLSAYLLEITSNKTYQDAANLSAAFIQNHLSKTVIFDTLNTSTCETNQGTFSYNSGFAIEGFAVLGNASSNETWTNLAHQLVATAVLFPTWTDPTGVIIEENLTDLVDAKNGFKRIFVRALHEVWSRNPQDSPIAEFIASYLTVQFNSILSVATIPQSDVYSPFWKGPPPVSGKLDALSQVITSYALNSAINLPVSASRTSEPESGSPSGASGLATPPTSTSSKHSAAVAVIVGGVIGGLVGLAVISGVVVFLFRRRRRHHHRYKQPQHPSFNPRAMTRDIGPPRRNSLGIDPIDPDPYSPRGSPANGRVLGNKLQRELDRGVSPAYGPPPSTAPPPSVVPPSSDGRRQREANAALVREVREVVATLLVNLRSRSEKSPAGAGAAGRG